MPFPAATLKTKLQLLKSRLIVRPSYFKEALLYDYTRQSMDELWVIVEKMSDEHALQGELKTYLRSRWKLIKGTMLSYTAIPDSDITDLFIEIAEKLSEAERSDTDSEHYSMALSILMPGVAVESNARTDFPDLDEASLNLKTILKTHILGRDGNYLIPVSLLIKKMDIASSAPLPNVYYDLFAYGHLPDTARTAFTTLNQAEVDRLYAHSALTKRLKDTKEAYSALLKDKTHLLGQCHILLRHLYFASVGGIGQEEIAASCVYPMMQSFFDYYDALDDEPIASLPEDFKAEINLLHRYFTGQKKPDIGSCLATRRGAIQAAMTGHEVLLSEISLGGDKKKNLIAEAKDAFEKARADLEKSIAISPKQYHGEDTLPITPHLIARTQTRLKFNSYQEAVTLINALTLSDITALFAMDEVKQSLYQALKTIEDWAMLIVLLSEDKLSALLNEIGKEILTHVLMTDMEAFIAFLDILTPTKQGILFNCIDGYTALIWAACRGYKDIVLALIDKGACLDEKDSDGDTALLLASSNGHKEIALALIDKGANLDKQNKDGYTALILAAFNDHKDIAIVLIDKGAKLDEKDKYDNTALILAVDKGHKEIALALINKGASLDEKNSYGNTALILAIRKGHKDIATALIDKGARLDEKDNDGKTALIWAVHNGHKEIALALIDKGAGTDEKDNGGKTALISAIQKDQKDIALALMDKGAGTDEKDNNGKTALIWAAIQGYKDIVLALIDKGARLDEKDSDGKTALISAIQKDQKDIALALMDKGARLDEKDNDDKTVLIWAAIQGYKDIVLALIDKGARLDEKDSDGKTALISAIEKDQKDIALALIDKGANLDEKDATGWTALFWAAYNGQKDIVLILIKNGADVSLITNRGDSALSIARAQGHTEIADAISVARAKQSLPSEAAPSDFFKAERPAVPLAADESHAGARVRSAWL